MFARQVHFEGRVQGVGFRFTTKQLAREFDVSGWVRNLPDGRVEMLVAADEQEEVEAFIQAIQESSLAHHIQNTVVQSMELTETPRGFEIR